MNDRPNMTGKHIKDSSEIRAIMVRKTNLLYSEKLVPQIKVGYRFNFLIIYIYIYIYYIYILFEISYQRGTALDEFVCIKLICFVLF